MSEFTDGLRAMADWFDQHPEYQGEAYGHATVHLNAEQLADFARAVGNAEKESNDYSFSLRRKFDERVSLRSWTIRDAVCEQVQVGERTVTRHVLPEGVELVEVTETEPVYEWRCPDSILRPVDESVAS